MDPADRKSSKEPNHQWLATTYLHLASSSIISIQNLWLNQLSSSLISGPPTTSHSHTFLASEIVVTPENEPFSSFLNRYSPECQGQCELDKKIHTNASPAKRPSAKCVHPRLRSVVKSVFARASSCQQMSPHSPRHDLVFHASNGLVGPTFAPLEGMEGMRS